MATEVNEDSSVSGIYDVHAMSNHRLLHILWTKAVGTPNYNKQEWMELELRLHMLAATPIAKQFQEDVVKELRKLNSYMMDIEGNTRP